MITSGDSVDYSHSLLYSTRVIEGFCNLGEILCKNLTFNVRIVRAAQTAYNKFSLIGKIAPIFRFGFIKGKMAPQAMG